MIYKVLLSLFCLVNISFAAYINITSNINNANIYIDQKYIGKTPLYGYSIEDNKQIDIKVDTNNSRYYLPVNSSLTVKPNTIETLHVTLKKGTGKINFIGQDAQLYINGKFINSLSKLNRTIEHEANKELLIELFNDNMIYKKSIDLPANSIKDFVYTMYLDNTQENLYTLIIENLMWQDHPDAVSKKEHYKDAKKYCDKLELASYKDWRVPTIHELQELYIHKDKIYNGFGDMYYWSSEEFVPTKATAWTYGYAFSFENEEYEKKVKDFYKGNIRCVRDMKPEDFHP